MKENKTIGIVLTDGVGYRNFVLSNFLKELKKGGNNVVIYSGLPINAFNNSLFDDSIKIIELPLYQETLSVWFFRKLKELSHMYQFRGFYGINDNLTRGYPKNNSKRSLLVKLAYAISKMFHSDRWIYKFERWQFASFQRDSITRAYKSLLENEDLDSLFFTHQRPPFLAPILSMANQLNIKTSTFIFSWDNLASKGRMLGEFDHYLVWSELMKNETLHFYPNTKEENIFVVGTPQFEPYVMEEYKMEKKEFLEKFDLLPDKKIICYSCADADIGRNDEVHIRAVMKYIQDRNDVQLLVRVSPAEDGKRFENLMGEFPQIKWNFPKWIQTRENHAESWSQRLPSVEDVIDLKSVLMYCDVNVNMASTMSLDFMIFDKPVINVAFGNPQNGLYDDQRYLNYVHYKYVLESKAVFLAMDSEALNTGLEEALDTPKKRNKEREELLNLEIGESLEGTSTRIVNVLNSI